MKVQLEKTYAMPGPAAAAWTVLSDIERVAACMPGARITERVDDTHYKGTVTVKFGPANMSFRGEVEVAQVDAAVQTVRLIGKGTDTTGGSGASMDITARVTQVDDTRSELVGKSEVSMSGKAAAFGSRMAGSVADQVLKQFATNFAAQVQAVVAMAQTTAGTTSAAAAPAAGPAQAHPERPAPGSLHAVTPEAAPMERPDGAPAPTPASTLAPPSVQAPPNASATAPTAAAPLNGLALAWALLKDWLRSLSGGRRT